MDNAQKAIMIGVGLFITIIIISAVLLIVNLGTGMVEEGMKNLGGLSSQMEQQIMAKYDGRTLSGSDVRSAITQYYSDTKLFIVVVNSRTNPTVANIVSKCGAMALNATLTGTVGGGALTVPNTTDSVVAFGTTTPKTTLGAYTDTPTAATYISPSTSYVSSVVRNAETNAIVGIVFAR